MHTITLLIKGQSRRFDVVCPRTMLCKKDCCYVGQRAKGTWVQRVRRNMDVAAYPRRIGYGPRRRMGGAT